MKKFALIAVTLTASAAVQANPNIQNVSAPLPTPKSKIAKKSLRARGRARPQMALSSLSAGGTPLVVTAAISERPSSAPRDARREKIATSQASATRLAMPGGTSTIQTKPAPRMIPVDNFKMAANIYYYGSSMMTPFDSRIPDFYYGYVENDSQDRVSADVHFMAGYRFHPNYTFSINPQFSINAAGPQNDNHFMNPIASFIRLSAGQFYSAGNFKWNGDLRYYPGITEDLQAGRVVHYFRTGQNLSFALTKDMSFSVYNTFRYYYRHSDLYESNPGQFDFRVTSSPTLEYQINDKAGVSLSYNMDHRKAQNVALFDIQRYTHDQGGAFLELGASLDFFKSVNLNPYIDSYVRRPNLYGTRWGMNVSWTIL